VLALALVVREGRRVSLARYRSGRAGVVFQSEQLTPEALVHDIRNDIRNVIRKLS
jgi:hypothetical protein